MAILMILGLGVTLTGALVVLSSAETRLADADRAAVEARYAAESALDRALIDLQAASSWSDVLAGVMPASFTVGVPTLELVDGTRVDLLAEGRAMQARTSAVVRRGADTPRWVLFGWGPLGDMLPPGTDHDSVHHVGIWVADDEAETDGRPDVDANQAVWLRAVAYGPRGARRAVEALVTRAGPGQSPIRRLTWRDGSEGG